MKKQLLILSISALCAWQPIDAAASSSAIALEPSTEQAVDTLSIPYFLRASNIRPKTITLTPYGYMRDPNTDIDAACAKLTHIERECRPVLSELFTHQPANESELESMLHHFIVARYAIARLFEKTYDSSGSTSFGSADSKPKPLKTFAQSLQDINRVSVKTNVYWDLLDERPDTGAAKSLDLQLQQSGPKRPRVTISTLRTWFTAFKQAQQTQKTPSTQEDFGAVFHDLFEARRRQMRTDRERIMTETAPGVAALATLQQRFPVQAPQQAPRSSSWWGSSK